MLGIAILIILIIIFIPGIKLKKENFEAGISYQKSQSLKGLLCIIIFLNHFTGWFTQLDPIMYILVHCGTQAVAVFFFLSSYGISKKYSGQPLNAVFIIKRFFSLLVPYWLCELVYCIVSLCTGISIKVPITFRNIILAFFALVEKSEIVENSWFVPVIGLMYLITVISSHIKLNLKSSTKILILFLIFSIITKGRWITTSVAFPLGAFIAEYEQKIFNTIKKHYILNLLLCILLLGGTFALKFIGQSNNIFLLMNISDFTSAIIFPLFLYMLICFINIGNFMLNFLSKISYEVYLCHGLMIRIAYSIFGTNSPLPFFSTSLLFTVISAFILNFIYKKIQDPIFKKLLKNR